MGLKADNAQLGQSNTASQNFNLRAPLDGTLRVDRGNDGAVLSTPIKIESNNDITLAGNLLSGVLGAGQTWQNMTGSRALATTYTNTTGKAIAVHIQLTSSASSGLTLLVSGNSFVSPGQSNVGSAIVISLIIPNGATYNCTLGAGAASNITWLELR